MKILEKVCVKGTFPSVKKVKKRPKMAFTGTFDFHGKKKTLRKNRAVKGVNLKRSSQTRFLGFLTFFTFTFYISGFRGEKEKSYIAGWKGVQE